MKWAAVNCFLLLFSLISFQGSVIILRLYLSVILFFFFICIFPQELFDVIFYTMWIAVCLEITIQINIVPVWIKIVIHMFILYKNDVHTMNELQIFFRSNSLMSFSCSHAFCHRKFHSVLLIGQEFQRFVYTWIWFQIRKQILSFSSFILQGRREMWRVLFFFYILLNSFSRLNRSTQRNEFNIYLNRIFVFSRELIERSLRNFKKNIIKKIRRLF